MRLVLVAVVAAALAGCGNVPHKLDAQDDAYCRDAVKQNPMRTYQQCREQVAQTRDQWVGGPRPNTVSQTVNVNH